MVGSAVGVSLTHFKGVICNIDVNDIQRIYYAMKCYVVLFFHTAFCIMKFMPIVLYSFSIVILCNGNNEYCVDSLFNDEIVFFMHVIK